MSTGGGMADGCRPARVSLPVLATSPAPRPATVARSRASRWRAAVLVAVHLVIAAHVVQWTVTGLTLSPVEPSESMHTLERGAVNAGFVFFAVAIAATAIFGRFFCGWGCHVVALQDLCSALMLRLGVRPKPFRSRLLVYVPLALAAYMFVWPTFRRVALAPLLERTLGFVPGWIGPVEPLHGFHSEFLVEDFWATFPPWWVAIPFLLVCGFAAVYVLGSKGFCTYVCPYGGIFGPVDQLAPGRILVTDACRQCGHCTAVCTSNVRVSEEVHAYGMVVDPGCMKCLDCVSVCPSDALYVGFARPAIAARVRDAEGARRVEERRQARYDLTVREEWAVAAVFLALFLGFRGLFGVVPLLMAGAMAAIGAYAAWTCGRLLRAPHAGLQNLRFKVKGRWRPAGVVFAALAVPYLLLGAHALGVNALVWRAEAIAAGVALPPPGVFLAPDYTPDEATSRASGRVLAAFAPARPVLHGGIALYEDRRVLRPMARAAAAGGRFAEAAALQRALVALGRPNTDDVIGLSRLLIAAGAPVDEAVSVCREAVTENAALEDVRRELVRLLAPAGRLPEVEPFYREAVARRRHDVRVREGYASLLLALGRPGEAADQLRVATRRRPGDASISFRLAAVLVGMGDGPGARAELVRLVERDPGNAEAFDRLAQLAEATGDSAGAAEWRRRAKEALNRR